MSPKRGPETYRGEVREQLTQHGADAYCALERALAVATYDARMTALQSLIDGKSHNQRNAVIGAMIVYLAGLPPRHPSVATPPQPPKPSARPVETEAA